MAKGTVKWFNDAKGFGFIEQQGGDEDVFVHYSAITSDGYRTLKEGQLVEFDINKEAKGLRAANVRISEGGQSEATPQEAGQVDTPQVNTPQPDVDQADLSEGDADQSASEQSA